MTVYENVLPRIVTTLQVCIHTWGEVDYATSFGIRC